MLRQEIWIRNMIPLAHPYFLHFLDTFEQRDSIIVAREHQEGGLL